MTYGPVPCRFAREVGWHYQAGAQWGTCAVEHHTYRWTVDAGDGKRGDRAPWQDGDRRHETDPVPDGAACEKCGAPYLQDAPEQRRWASYGPTYSTDAEGGIRTPGTLYWAEWLPHDPVYFPTPLGPLQMGLRCWPAGWVNCDGRHLHAVHGFLQLIDGRSTFTAG